MSAFGGKADINRRCPNVRFCPKADMSGSRLLLCKLTGPGAFPAGLVARTPRNRSIASAVLTGKSNRVTALS